MDCSLILKSKMKNILFLFLLSISHFAYSQSVSRLQGNVISSKKKGLPFVTISLLKASDSNMVKASISNESGSYDFFVTTPDLYLIEFSLVGYEKSYSSVFRIEAGKNVQLDDITLKESLTTLTNHIVTSKKPFIELKGDKMVLNVESSINNSGINAFELLRKSPGIQVDNNDNISMKGKSGVRVSIDGKMTQFDAKDLSAYLKSINSSEIESVELISNPSSKYEASGSAGIINISLKKNKKYGTNASVNLDFIQGVTPKSSGNLNLNHRNKKMNYFGNLAINIGVNRNAINLYREQKDTLYDFKNINKQKELNFNIKAGADYSISNKSTIGFLFLLNNNNSDELGFSNTPIYLNSTHEFVKNLQSNSLRKVQFRNSNFNLNYLFTDTAEKEINFDANYGTYRKVGESYQPNIYLDNNNNLLSAIINRNETPVNIDIYNFKFDYEKKIRGGKIGLGFKSNLVKTNNTFNFFTDDVNSIPVKDLNRSNLFNYKEFVNAGYFNFYSALNKKWSYQLGLRLEQTNSEGILNRQDTIIQLDNDVKKSYLDYFSSAAITWQFNEKNTFNLSYSRRIDRPTYQDLNPFENKLDELTFQKGNAFLKPQYTHSIQLIHNYKSILNTTIGYSKVSDYSTEVTDTITNATYIQQQNLATQQIINAEIGIQTPIKKWWNCYMNIWCNYKTFDGSIGNNLLHQEITSYGVNFQQSFNLGKEYAAEINGWYDGPSVWGLTWKTQQQSAIDIGVQKMLLKKTASVKLTITDLFFTAPWKSHNKFGGVDIQGNGDWESRTLKISFNWRIGSNQIGSSRKRETGIESETKRIKSGQKN